MHKLPPELINEIMQYLVREEKLACVHSSRVFQVLSNRDIFSLITTIEEFTNDMCTPLVRCLSKDDLIDHLKKVYREDVYFTCGLDWCLEVRKCTEGRQCEFCQVWFCECCILGGGCGCLYCEYCGIEPDNANELSWPDDQPYCPRCGPYSSDSESS